MINKQQQPNSSIHDTCTDCPRVPIFNFLCLTVPEKSVKKNVICLIIGEIEKRRNKGTNKWQQPDSGIHDTSTHCQ